jgi:hypothetical protein
MSVRVFNTRATQNGPRFPLGLVCYKKFVQENVNGLSKVVILEAEQFGVLESCQTFCCSGVLCGFGL